MLDEFVCPGNFVQAKSFSDIEAVPTSFKGLSDTARGRNLGVSRYIVTADEENSGVAKDELPERKFQRRSICGVSCNGTTLCEYRNVDVDIRRESHFNNVINALGCKSPDAFRQALIT